VINIPKYKTIIELERIYMVLSPREGGYYRFSGKGARSKALKFANSRGISQIEMRHMVKR